MSRRANSDGLLEIAQRAADRARRELAEAILDWGGLDDDAVRAHDMIVDLHHDTLAVRRSIERIRRDRARATAKRAQVRA